MEDGRVVAGETAVASERRAVRRLRLQPEQPQPRGVIVRILDRFVQSAVRRTDPNADAHSRFPDKPAH